MLRSDKTKVLTNFHHSKQSTVAISDSSSECIVPFRHSLSPTFREDGITSGRKDEFLRAFELAQEKDVEDNDGLPSADWAIQTVASPKKPKRTGRLIMESHSRTINCSRIVAS